VTFDFQFYLYQEANLFNKVLVATVMGVVLLLLCLKLFCCKKTESSLVLGGDDGHDKRPLPQGIDEEVSIARRRNTTSSRDKEKNSKGVEFTEIMSQTEGDQAADDEEE